MSQRKIIKVDTTYPWNGTDVSNGHVLTGTVAPPISIRKKAANNSWWIEKKVYASGTAKAGKEYWQFIKDPSSVSHLVGKTVSVGQARKTTGDQPSKSPKPQKKTMTVWGDRDWKEESTRYLPRSTKELLAAGKKPTDIPNADSSDESIIKFIADSVQYKPDFLVMMDSKWKLLIRSALRGDNVELRGDKGEGKTMSAYALANALNRPLYSINFGNMQDAQTALIGKTHLDTSKGTYFGKSYFVEAITTPNSIVLLDELSRGTDDAFNIIMPVLDLQQRYLRLNDEVNSPKVEVAEGVCFIATSNIGHAYSATRALDAALSDRFTTKIEVDILTKPQRNTIISSLFPTLTLNIIAKITGIAHDINSKVYAGEGELNLPMSTRTCISVASIIHDGIGILDAIENGVYPDYSDESERTYLKQLVQGYKLQNYELTNQVYKSQKQKVVEIKDESTKETKDVDERLNTENYEI